MEMHFSKINMINTKFVRFLKIRYYIIINIKNLIDVKIEEKSFGIKSIKSKIPMIQFE